MSAEKIVVSVSVTSLARQMGLKSRNSLFRILNDQTSNALEAAFLAELRKSQALLLTQAEWAALDEALEISRVGVSDYRNNLAIHTLLQAVK